MAYIRAAGQPQNQAGGPGNINFMPASTAGQKVHSPVSREELARRKALAKALQTAGGGIQDIRHWTQGASQLSDAIFGVMADKKNAEDRKDHNAVMAQVLMGNGGGGPISGERLAQIMALNPKLGTQLYAQQREVEQAQQLQAQRMAAEQARLMDQRAYDAAQTADQRAYDQQQWQQRQQSQNEEWNRRQEYARENAPRPETGFIVSGEQAAEYGLDPAGSYNITAGPNGVSASRIGGGGTNVTVNNAGDAAPVPAYPKAPNGFMYVRDPASGDVVLNEQGIATMAPIIGGPEDTAEQDALAAEAKERSANIVMDEISIARDLITGQSWNSPATGVTGRAASLIDSSRAGSLKNRLETIKANIGFDKLQAMRDASPTGGALGQVSEFENRLLQAVWGSLEQAQRSEDLLYNLERLEGIYGRIIHQGIPEQEARQLYRDIALGNQPDASTDTQTGTAAPTGVDPELWQHMTPEEKALWQ